MSAARYYQRSPRYVYRPEDKSLMRYAGLDTKGEALAAKIRDLSSSGLSFVVSGNSVPFENETLKIEFGVPGGRQLAWFATVVRVESRTEWDQEAGEKTFTLIALKFRQLPTAIEALIEKSLGERIDENEEPFPETRDVKAIVVFVAFFLLSTLTSYWMSLPLKVWLAHFRL